MSWPHILPTQKSDHQLPTWALPLEALPAFSRFRAINRTRILFDGSSSHLRLTIQTLDDYETQRTENGHGKDR